ncbi:hypothetical protein [Cytobacillus praedii]|uniref:hypothetical protein n=1 Tax=Cytobacillus praedii TaxID=1742358 RepID=UPI002E23F0F5|nr:hypothetical protein [Cytobacillus praedii]
MYKTIIKIVVTCSLFISLLGGNIGQDTFQAEAATKNVLPDNHTIEQLNVKYYKDSKNGYLIDVGDRKGTLLIRVDRPKKEWDIQWVNWSIQKPMHVSFGLQLHKESDKHLNPQPIDFGITYERYLKDRGVPDKWGLEVGRLKSGLMKFSNFDNPNYYAGLAIFLDKKYNESGIYWFGGNSIAIPEDGQLKAYFYHEVDVVIEAYNRIFDNGTFPLMSKIMWGKTELLKGQLGKVTSKQPTTLWKRLDNAKLEKVRDLKQGEEYRVYRYIEENGGLYGVGSGMFVQKDTSKVLYETPSKKNLRLVKIMNGE